MNPHNLPKEQLVIKTLLLLINRKISHRKGDLPSSPFTHKSTTMMSPLSEEAGAPGVDAVTKIPLLEVKVRDAPNMKEILPTQMINLKEVEAEAPEGAEVTTKKPHPNSNSPKPMPNTSKSESLKERGLKAIPTVILSIALVRIKSREYTQKSKIRTRTNPSG